MINDDKADRFQLGVKFSCQVDGAAASSCQEAAVNGDARPDDLPVPDVALRLRCSKRTTAWWYVVAQKKKGYGWSWPFVEGRPLTDLTLWALRFDTCVQSRARSDWVSQQVWGLFGPPRVFCARGGLRGLAQRVQATFPNPTKL
jgi:hypothetical protein